MQIVFNGEQQDVRQLAVLGWAGRSREAVQHHIDELAAIGVQPPSEVPLFYYAAPQLLTQEDSAVFLGDSHSGEAEVCLFCDNSGALWVSVGSDHTDRALEAYSVPASKQICAKPVAAQAWRLEEVRGHWDSLVLESELHAGGQSRLYQSGTIAELLHIDDVLARLPADLSTAAGRPNAGLLLLCGTVPVIGGIDCKADALTIRLHDPVKNRTISHTYQQQCLPVKQ